LPYSSEFQWLAHHALNFIFVVANIWLYEWPIFDLSHKMNSNPLESLTQAKFTESLNTPFSVNADSGGAIELQLIEITAGPAAASSGPDAVRYESFSLLFHGPANRFLPQKTYSFDHPQIGKFALFIVPVGKEGDQFKYQAVFNRRVQPA
jgi:hypothetical protein